MFITFEGSEGSGKTSQISRLACALQGIGSPVLCTREPGGTLIGEQIRTVLHKLENTEMKPRTEILLFQASRAQLVEQVIRPALQRGEVVISDRYADSTLAYQGYGYQVVELELLRSIIHFATGGLEPDLTLLLDVNVEEGLKRRSQGGEWNRLDAYSLAFYQRVQAGYYEMVKAEPQRWVIIDANQSPDLVHAAVWKVVTEHLGIRQPGG
jgi:dTMP kinase